MTKPWHDIHTDISRRPIRDQIAEKLVDMIQTGLLQAGDNLPPERTLAQTFNVSRASIRGAIAILHSEQLVRVVHGNRTQVTATDSRREMQGANAAAPGDVDIARVAEARRYFESDVVRLAARRTTPDTLARLRQLVQEQHGMVADPVRFQISDREFHLALYAACDNPLMGQVASDLYHFALDIRRRVLRRTGAIAQSVRDHEQIIEAIADGDAERAGEMMRRHQERIGISTRDEIGP